MRHVSDDLTALCKVLNSDLTSFSLGTSVPSHLSQELSVPPIFHSIVQRFLDKVNR